MMDFNDFFADVLVKHKQEQLRASHDPLFSHRETGAIRKATGRYLIRLGARIGGIPFNPDRPALSKKLAHP